MKHPNGNGNGMGVNPTPSPQITSLAFQLAGKQPVAVLKRVQTRCGGEAKVFTLVPPRPGEFFRVREPEWATQ